VAKPKVYVETSIVSYLTARPSRDIVTLGLQQTTRDWWDNQREKFDLYTSQLVIRESRGGDQEAARKRLEALANLPVLAITPEAESVANQLLQEGALPAKAADDALHIAMAAMNGMEYLLTWNCRHIANAVMRPLIEDICREAGLEPPIICTPIELLEEEESDA
jgi:predicted nucleic acid-binding protein